MATSGTVGLTEIPLVTIIEHAARRARIPARNLTPEVLQVFHENLSILFMELINKGLQLWTVEKENIALYAYHSTYELDAGEQDVRRAYLKTPARLTVSSWATSDGGDTTYLDDGDFDTVFTQAGVAGNLVADFGDPTVVRLIGILPGSTASGVTLTFEVSSNGVDWSALSSLSGVDLVDNQWKWVEVANGMSQQYFRVTASAAYTLSFRELFLAQSAREISMSRMNQDDYSALPDKYTTSTAPVNFWLKRGSDKLTAHLWPVPTEKFQIATFWIRRKIQDVGDSYLNTVEVPDRWLQAVIDTLSYRAGKEIPEVDLNHVDRLKGYSDESLAYAEGEEVDRGPVMLTPNIRGYTR